MDNVERFLAGSVSYHQRHKLDRMQWTPYCEVCRNAVDAIILMLSLNDEQTSQWQLIEPPST